MKRMRNERSQVRVDGKERAIGQSVKGGRLE